MLFADDRDCETDILKGLLAGVTAGLFAFVFDGAIPGRLERGRRDVSI